MNDSIQHALRVETEYLAGVESKQTLSRRRGSPHRADGRRLKVITLEPEQESLSNEPSSAPAPPVTETSDEPRVLIRGRGDRVIKTRSKSSARGSSRKTGVSS